MDLDKKPSHATVPITQVDFIDAFSYVTFCLTYISK